MINRETTTRVAIALKQLEEAPLLELSKYHLDMLQKVLNNGNTLTPFELFGMDMEKGKDMAYFFAYNDESPFGALLQYHVYLQRKKDTTA